MPKSIECLSEQLSQYLEAFRACLMCFLAEQRAADPQLHLACGDVSRSIQHQHRLILLLCLEDRFKEGCSIDHCLPVQPQEPSIMRRLKLYISNNTAQRERHCIVPGWNLTMLRG
jgi:hypothetical protein